MSSNISFEDEMAYKLFVYKLYETIGKNTTTI